MAINLGDAILYFKGDTQNLDAATGKMTDSMAAMSRMVGIGMTAVGGAITGAIGVAVYEFAQGESAAAQLEAVLKSTGGAAGMTKDELSALASELQRTTTFEDEAVMGAESMLLTFTNIGRDVFPEATRTVLDMSQALGQDLKSSSIQLGKALNDPIAGITALSRVGVTFTEEQKDQIKVMVESGNIMGAQKLILAELSREFGGSAVAAATMLTGKWMQLNNAFGDMMEGIGNALTGGGGFQGLLDVIKQTVIGLTEWIQAHPHLTAAITITAGAIGGLMLALGPVLIVLPGLVSAFGILSGAGALGGVATAATGAAAAIGGVGVAGALLAAAPWIVAIGAIGIALVAIGKSAWDTKAAFDELDASQDKLDATEKRYIETLKAKGAILDEAEMKNMDYAQRQAYLADQEDRALDMHLRAYIEYFAGRTETEVEFETAKNLRMNENLTAEEAAQLATRNLTTDTVREIMGMNEEQTRNYLEQVSIQATAAGGLDSAISESAMDGARARQEAYMQSAQSMVAADEEATSTLGAIWRGFISGFQEMMGAVFEAITAQYWALFNRLAGWLGIGNGENALANTMGGPVGGGGSPITSGGGAGIVASGVASRISTAMSAPTAGGRSFAQGAAMPAPIINITFPSVTIRQDADISLISRAIAERVPYALAGALT